MPAPRDAITDADIDAVGARFTPVQDSVWGQARAELAAGRKSTHWIWWIFPQLSELGRSSTARNWGLSGTGEAAAYWRHPVLSARLRDCCELLLALPDTARIAPVMGGDLDALKLRSSMTLFEAATADPIFGQVLDRFYNGARDPLTTNLIAHSDTPDAPSDH